MKRENHARLYPSPLPSRPTVAPSFAQSGRSLPLATPSGRLRSLFSRALLITVGATLAVGTSHFATAATLCVNPGGTKGCFSKITDAVTAAKPHDTIQVAAGTYAEDVVIGKSLALIGANPKTTLIDATGLSNAIYIDGLDNPKLRDVVVQGFTAENANFEGILVTNASNITIWNSEVLNNDKSLDIQNGTCPGIPPFETGEDFDCGEGIHLIGTTYSTVSNNTVEQNSGGVLISDDTAAIHDNLISGNSVKDNTLDCGITLASHPPFTGTTPFGVSHNTISGNLATGNGTNVKGAGAGVGIFDSVPGASNQGNVIINNRLTHNGLPGVAMHSHTPGQNLNDNIIVGNFIAGNGPDTDDAATPGPTGINVFGVSAISGTVISQNVIQEEAYDIVANTSAQVNAHLNNLLGNKTGLDNIGKGSVDATENYWGCPDGPKNSACSSVKGSKVLFNPWLKKAF
jgi:parallel beta-helix repeat protein